MAVTRPTGTGSRVGHVSGAVLALVLVLATPAPAFTSSPAESPVEPRPDGKDGGKAGDGGRPGEGRKAGGGVRAGELGPPTLSIGVDNGRTSARKGDRLTYTVTVRNIGTTDARGLHLTQSLPEGLRFLSADRGGRARPGQVTWAVDLKAGRNATVHTTAEVQDTPGHLLRLATVACASAMKGGRPIVCATHSDRLPSLAWRTLRAGLESGPVLVQ
ncbi:hypothetical protein, partial [Streptosporangium sp. NPDC048865]|uniref:hypothetical protein n=1 Tax=Streptosporangium sp. NPDC048865 TaxID=3155766 RepID=UPI00342ECA6D